MAKMALSEQKKTSVDKRGPFDRQRELMPLQDSLMPPLKPHARKTGELLKTDREDSVQKKVSLFDRRPHESIKGPFTPTKGFFKTTGGGGM